MSPAQIVVTVAAVGICAVASAVAAHSTAVGIAVYAGWVALIFIAAGASR